MQSIAITTAYGDRILLRDISQEAIDAIETLVELAGAGWGIEIEPEDA